MPVGANKVSSAQSLSFKVSPPPVGTVVTFNGTVSDIPDGWALADGQNSTVNLQGYFVEGTDSDSDVKTTEGEDTKEITTVPDHQHPDATWNDPGDGGSHKHEFGGYSSASSGDSFAGSKVINQAYPSGGTTFDVSASHDHNTANTTSSSGAGTATVENRPSYVNLHYIQRIE